MKERNMNESEKEQGSQTESSKSVSRRGFLKGAAVSAAVAGAAGVIGAPLAMAETASANGVPAAAKPIPPIAPPAKWDKDADVVIVGAGGGGLAAALRLAESGKSVIVVDKLQGPGGGSQEAGLFFTFGGTRLQNAIKFALPAFPYNPDALVEMVSPWYQQTADKRLLRSLAVNGPACVDWLEDHGVPWELDLENDPMTGAGTHIWKGACKGGNYTRAMKPVTDLVYEQAKKKGAEFLFKTAVVRLVEDKGRIVGIKCKDLDGQTLFLHAKKGVLLAAGGFASNRDMLEKYTPYANQTSGSSFAMPCDTGEVVRMGFGAGADVTGLGSVSSFDGGVDWEGRGTWHQYLYNGSTQLARQPWLSVDISGERYPYFNSDPASGLWFQANVEGSRRGGRGYVIFDGDYETNIWKFKQTFCRKPLTPTMPNADRVPDWLTSTDWREGVKIALDAGVIKKANTLAELGHQIGFDPGVLEKSVADWNEVCASGKDNPVYGYKPEWLIPVQKAPYYGIKLGAFLYATACGLRVTPGMQVVNTKGKSIPGLYAAFHTAGGQVGDQAVSGISILADVGLSLTGGYIAADTILKQEA
jgi:fumarate reductase flavoprotein subunit